MATVDRHGDGEVEARARRGDGWRVGDVVLGVHAPVVMGILNVTPDSFSDGGQAWRGDGDPRVAIERGLALVAQGADIVDVGGESTRPGAAAVSVDQELARTAPVVAALADAGVRVSIDTTKAAVAGAAIDAGALVVNDVSAGRLDDAMVPLVVARDIACVLMHMVGTPRTMQADPQYHDVVDDVTTFLVAARDRVVASGLAGDRIAVDPGIGFGKTVRHNLQLLDATERLAAVGPLVVGASRKSFLGAVTGVSEAADRDPASTAIAAMAVARGAMVVRAHDVAATRQAVDVAWAVIGTRH